MRLLKGAPGGREAMALTHTRGLDCFEHKLWEEETPAVTAGGKDGVSTQGQSQLFPLGFSFALCRQSCV